MFTHSNTFFLICILLPIVSFSQSNISQTWVQRYNYTSNYWDVSFGIAADKHDNVYVTGYSWESQLARNIVTIKYNSNGTQEWVQRYGSGLAHEICLDDSSNVYIVGINSYDIVTIKYNQAGTMQWAAIFNGTGDGVDDGLDITTDVSGNVYVTGFTSGIGTDKDFITIKYNNIGIQQWAQFYNGSGNSSDEAHSIAIDGIGNVYVTGRAARAATTIKYNNSGILQWAASYSVDGTGYDVKVDRNNNVYINGTIYQNGNYDYVTIKYNSNGVQQWSQTYNGPGNGDDVSQWIEIDSSGNIFITGRSYGGTSSGDDFATIKYNHNGSQQWVSRFNFAGSCDWARNIKIDNNGNVYVCGHSCVPVGGTYDFTTVKYNGLTGTQQWVISYNGTGDSSDYGWALALDSSNNVYVTGASFGIGTGRDIVTVKYSQTIGIQQISNQIPTEYSLEQNYPNPFNPLTKIRFSIPTAEIVKLIIYDVLGREISTLVNESLKPGVYETEWNSENLGSGIYFYSLRTSFFSETRKMVVIK